MANPNPTDAVSVEDLVPDKPIVNVPGCPPIPTVITGVLAHYLTFGALPELDHLKRPKVFFGQNIHDRCYRRPFYERGEFAETFDDEGARKGWCLFKLGCKGPTTYNACATAKWNQGTSWPVEAGHGCIGCSEPQFWDAGSFYRPLSAPFNNISDTILTAGAAGLAVGAAAAVLNRKNKAEAVATRETITIKDLEKES
jgi:hydrogenase small subunit